jgi:hypothetical protein
MYGEKMNLSNFNSIKKWYTQYLEKQSAIENKERNITLIANQSFYLFDLGIMPDFFDQLDSENFEQIINDKVGSAANREDIIKNILEFKKTFKRYFLSYKEWKSKNNLIPEILTAPSDDTTTKDIIVATYLAAKAYYENTIDVSDKKAYFDEIKKYSEESSKLFKEGSAGIYLTIFLKMLDGKVFSGNPSDEYTRYFLEHIYKDYGFEKLNNALTSLALHIEKSIQHKISLGNEIAKKYNTKFSINNMQ